MLPGTTTTEEAIDGRSTPDGGRLRDGERCSRVPAPGLRPGRLRIETGRPRVVTACVVALVGLAALLVYCRTLAPSIVWGDSPELTAAAFCAGVPHPTGYPLYMLLAHAFLRAFSSGSVAYRMNLLSAISAGFTVAALYPVMQRVTRSGLASFAATLAFAFSQAFWSQAVIAEVYAFHMLCVVAVLPCVLAWDRRGNRGWLLAAALGFGLSLTYHMMSVLLAPGLLSFVLTSRHRRAFVRDLRWTVPLFLLPLCLYAYLPLAALRDSPVNWGDPRTLSRFLGHVTGGQYHHAMFTLPPRLLMQQVRDYAGSLSASNPGYLRTQYGAGLLCLAVLGAWCLARRRRLFGLAVWIYLTTVTFALNY